MLSQTAEYALRAVLYLAERGSPDPVRVDEMAGALDIPSNYLSKTLHALVRAKVLSSMRGRHGGFRLAVPAEKLPLHRVIAPFDEMPERRRCLLGRPECSDQKACAAHVAWKQTAEKVSKFFRTTTVADIRSGPAAAQPSPASRPRRSR